MRFLLAWVGGFNIQVQIMKLRKWELFHRQSHSSQLALDTIVVSDRKRRNSITFIVLILEVKNKKESADDDDDADDDDVMIKWKEMKDEHKKKSRQRMKKLDFPRFFLIWKDSIFLLFFRVQSSPWDPKLYYISLNANIGYERIKLLEFFQLSVLWFTHFLGT